MNTLNLKNINLHSPYFPFSPLTFASKWVYNVQIMTINDEKKEMK